LQIHTSARAEVFGVHGPTLGLEEHRDLLPGLAAELADDRGGVEGLYDLLLVVVGMEVGVFVPEGVDVVIVVWLLGSFHRAPPIA
jgi:hypothetical protein